MKIIDDNAPFVSIIWHQTEPLGCVVYSHCPTNDSYNKCIYSCCLSCNYVTRPFSILQRIIKNKRCVYHWTQQKSIPFPSEKFVAKFFRPAFKFSGLIKRCLPEKFRPYESVVFKKKWGNVLTLQTAHGNCLTFCRIALHSNVNFLIRKQNKTTKIDPKMLKQ